MLGGPTGAECVSEREFHFDVARFLGAELQEVGRRFKGPPAAFKFPPLGLVHCSSSNSIVASYRRNRARHASRVVFGSCAVFLLNTSTITTASGSNRKIIRQFAPASSIRNS